MQSLVVTVKVEYIERGVQVSITLFQPAAIVGIAAYEFEATCLQCSFYLWSIVQICAKVKVIVMLDEVVLTIISQQGAEL